MPWLARPSLVERTAARSGCARGGLRVARLPAKAANCGDQADDAPDENGCERAALRPDVVVPDDDVARELREIGERQDIRERSEKARVLLRREERAGDD